MKALNKPASFNHTLLACWATDIAGSVKLWDFGKGIHIFSRFSEKWFCMSLEIIDHPGVSRLNDYLAITNIRDVNFAHNSCNFSQ